jgi:hypothetical protein
MLSAAVAGKKEKGNLTGKKETIIVNGRSLFVVGHYHDARLSCLIRKNCFLFLFYLSFHFSLLQHGRESVLSPPSCVFYTVWMSLLLRTAQQSRGVNLFLFDFYSILFQRVKSKNPAFNAAIAFYNLIVQGVEYQS